MVKARASITIAIKYDVANDGLSASRLDFTLIDSKRQGQGHVRLTLVDSKGQGQGLVHVDCEDC